MLRVVLHHLLLHGTGLGVGPDCDGMLNLMDNTPPPSRGASEEPSAEMVVRLCHLILQSNHSTES